VNKPLVAGDLLRKPPGTALADPVILPLTFAAGLLPSGLAPGDVVTVYPRNPNQPGAIQPTGCLVVALEPLEGSAALDGTTPKRVTLMAPGVMVAPLVASKPSNLTLVLPPQPVSTADLVEPPPALTMSPFPNVRRADGTVVTNPLEPPAADALSTIKAMNAEIRATASASCIDWTAPMPSLLNEPDEQKERAAAYVDAAAYLAVLGHIDLHSPEDTEKDVRDYLESTRDSRGRDRVAISKTVVAGTAAFAEGRDAEVKASLVEYPRSRGAIAATKVGNVLAAVDSYAGRLYGLDLQLVLPRLRTVLAKESLERIVAAEERFQLAQWTCLGAGAVGTVGTGMALWGRNFGLALLVWSISIPIASFAATHVAPGAALSYGEHLRVALDAERGKVLGILGVTVENPTNQSEEERTWIRIGRWWELGNAPGPYTLSTGEAAPPTNQSSAGKPESEVHV